MAAEENETTMAVEEEKAEDVAPSFSSRAEMEKLVSMMEAVEDPLPEPATKILAGLKQCLQSTDDYTVADRVAITVEPEWNPQYPNDAQHWVTGPKDLKEIYFSGSGIGVDEPRTIGSLFEDAVGFRADEIAYEREVDGEMQGTTWTEYLAECKQFAKAAMHVGCEDGDAINIIGFNSREWVIADVGIILANGIAAGQYATNNSGQVQYIANHSRAKVMVVENQKQLAKMVSIDESLTDLVCYVTWAMSDDELEEMKPQLSKPVYSFEEFLTLGDNVSDDDLTERTNLADPRRCCTLIYTSGTTGNPKAVMMSHDNLSWTSKACMLQSMGVDTSVEYRTVSYLPLSHVAAQLLDIISTIRWAAEGKANAKIIFARPDALKGTLFATLAKAKPTFFFGVPRVWEKLKAGIIAKAASKGPLMDAVIGWAKQCCKERWDNNMISRGDDQVPIGYPVAKSIMNKVKESLGLDVCQSFLTGAAPISRETLEFYKYLDICLDEVYGMSETAGPLSIGRVYHRETGSCGPVLDGCEAKIEHVDGRDKDGEGELCFRGRNIMMGYLYNEEKTIQALDDEGFMHSGDVARFDAQGNLYITGRIKELIITEGGENIAPVPVEGYIKSNRPALSNFIMIGDKRKYCSCIVSLKQTVDPATGLPTGILDGPAKDVSEATTVEEAKNDEAWAAYIQSGIDEYNENEDICVSRACRIQYYKILDTDLNQANDTLGPTLKVKRPVVHTEYAELIESMYQV